MEIVVLTEGDKRNKNLIEIRDKFLEVLPDYFNIVVIRERNSTANGGAGRFVHPAHYPAHYPNALAGTPQPKKNLTWTHLPLTSTLSGSNTSSH